MQNTLLALPHDLPTFEAAIQDLDDVPNTLYRGLEHAAYKTSEFRNGTIRTINWMVACPLACFGFTQLSF
jgi:hypothetical protein